MVITGIEQEKSWLTPGNTINIVNVANYVILNNGIIMPVTTPPVTDTTIPYVRSYVSGDLASLYLNSAARQWTASSYGTAYSPNNSFNIADETAGLVRFRIDTDGSVTSFISLKTPILYDSNNTSYYLDATGPSYWGGHTFLQSGTNLAAMYSTPAYGVSQGDNRTHLGYYTSSNTTYVNYIRGAVTYFPASIQTTMVYDVDDTAYYVNPNGTSYVNISTANRFYTDYDSGVANSFSCSGWFRSNGSTGWYNGTYGGGIFMEDTTYVKVYGSKQFYCGSASWGSIFYDANDSGYYCDPNGNSHFNTLNLYGNEFILQGGSPTMHFNDTDQQCAVLHNNSNVFYILRKNSYGVAWTTVGSGWWPMTVDLTNNNVSWGGDINAAYNIIAYASDKRLKENIVEIPNAIDKIKKIRGVTFDWNDKADELGFKPKTKYNDLGVIAQEIQAVLPQAVAPAPFDKWQPDPDKNYSDEYLDENRDTSRSGENYLTVQLEKIIPLLIEGIKEQQQQIDSLMARLG